eukprot:m.99096 g.99096  ORF g.99096 m.99096 type:complete len:109 (-) comp13663_c0_seq1:219-545(-)
MATDSLPMAMLALAKASVLWPIDLLWGLLATVPCPSAAEHTPILSFPLQSPLNCACTVLAIVNMLSHKVNGAMMVFYRIIVVVISTSCCCYFHLLLCFVIALVVVVLQ